jgi:hypothetical protein
MFFLKEWNLPTLPNYGFRPQTIPLCFIALTSLWPVQARPAQNQLRTTATQQSTVGIPGVTEPNRAKGDNYQVNVTSVMDVTSGGATLHQIAYTYSFAGTKSVYIKGIGATTSAGSFSYMTSDPTLQFLDAPGGHLLAEVKLQATGVPMGTSDTELPDMPSANSSFRSGSWKPATTFPSAVTAIIQKYFLSYSTREVGSEHYYLTTFRTLRLSDPQISGQIALIVSQPYDVSRDQLSYHIQFVLRDRPRMSAKYRTGSDISEVTQTAAMDFLNSFISDVASQGPNK